MWSHIFAPFVFLNFLPVFFLTVINFWLIDHSEFSHPLLIVYSILVVTLTYGNLRSLYWEVNEMIHVGFKEYFSNRLNYY
jgi:hypothetical protein